MADFSQDIDVDEDDFYPKTINEAIEAFMSQDITDSDSEYIEDASRSDIDKILPDFESTIRIVCGFDDGNVILLEECGDRNLDPHDASRVIMLAIWDYFHQ